MKKVNYFFILLIIVNHVFCASNIITQHINPGRLGDHLLAYIRAKMLSEIYHIPFFLSPFQHCEQLVMYTAEKKITESMKRNKRIAKVTLSLDPYVENTVFIAYAYVNKEQDEMTRGELYNYMRDKPDFARKIKAMIAPIHPVQLLDLPKDRITVAVHVRKGSGADNMLALNQQPVLPKYRYENVSNPEKFPEDSYYVEQVQVLSELLHDVPLFVYIFTDAKDPAMLTKYYEKMINKKNITFGYRPTTNNGNSFIIEDLFAMAYQFDCLIRGKSGLSYIAELIGDHKVVICTKNAKWIEEQGVVIDKVEIRMRNNNTVASLLFNEKNYEAIQQALVASFTQN